MPYANLNGSRQSPVFEDSRPLQEVILELLGRSRADALDAFGLRLALAHRQYHIQPYRILEILAALLEQGKVQRAKVGVFYIYWGVPKLTLAPAKVAEQVNGVSIE